MKDFLQKLEHAVLDLGAEVYTLKDQLADMQKENIDLKKSVSTLSQFLGEKGLVDFDELELAGEDSFDLMGFLSEEEELQDEDDFVNRKIHH